MAPQPFDQRVTGEAGAGPTGTLQAKAAATVLWEVQDLSLVIEPGAITVSGRLPVGEGLRLQAQLLRDGQPADWLTPGDSTDGYRGQRPVFPAPSDSPRRPRF